MTDCTDEELVENFDLERAQRNLETAETAPVESQTVSDCIWVELRMALAKIRLQAKEIANLKDPDIQAGGLGMTLEEVKAAYPGVFQAFATPASATHADLDRAAAFTFARRISATQTSECPMWNPLEGCYEETDAQLRARMIQHMETAGAAYAPAHTDRGPGFTHHDADACTTPLQRMEQVLELGKITPPDPERYTGRRPSASMDAAKMRVAPNWADEHIAALRRGETVTLRPRGKSMEPMVMDGQEVMVETCRLDRSNLDVSVAHPRMGDIVLVTVNERQYLHKIVDVSYPTNACDVMYYQIGNNRGGINGWVTRDAIHGRMVR